MTTAKLECTEAALLLAIRVANLRKALKHANETCKDAGRLGVLCNELNLPGTGSTITWAEVYTLAGFHCGD